METLKMIRILKNHSINFELKNERIIAEDGTKNGKVIYKDITNMSLSKLSKWLGY